MRFLYYLAAIGTPYIDEKLIILRDNLTYLYNHLGVKISIIINCYNSDEKVKELIGGLHFLDNVYYHIQEGILTELWLTNPYNEKVNEYDFMLFMLDDVFIESLTILDMIEAKKKHNIQFLSPRVIDSSHRYMNIYDNYITITNCIEVYCLLLSPNDFLIYTSVNSIENKWMWGVDFLFGHFGIKCGLFNESVVHHKFKNNKKNNKDACILMKCYFKKHGFNSLEEVRKKYPDVIEQIDDENNNSLLLL